MKILCTNDWHFASKNPVSRTDDYNAELFSLLDQLLRLINHFRPAAVLHAGDLFHDKGRAPWSVIIRMLEWFGTVSRTYCPVLVVPGNHDLLHDRYQSRAETPIGALIGSGLVIDVSHQTYPLGVYGPKIYGVPWPDASQPDAFATIPSDVDIVMAHGFADEVGEPRYGTFCHKYDDLARQNPQVRLWHFGHDHSDHGVYTCKNAAKVINIGSLCRGALDTDALSRQVKVAVVHWPDAESHGPGWQFTIAPCAVQQIALTIKPADEIFDLQLREQKVEERRQIEQFVEQLRVGLPTFDVDFQSVLAALPLDATVRAKVQGYIERAEATV